MTTPSRPLQVAVLFAAAVLPAAFTLDPKLDHDTWWHLRVGQLIAESGTVPDTDPFSRLGRERPTPWVAYSWLYEWGLYQTYAAFGSSGVLWARTLLGAASTAAVFALLPNRGWRMLPAVLLAGVALMPLMKERPWHLTVVFTALTAGVVASVRGGSPVSRAWWLVLLYVVWANIHVQFVMGWLVLGLACVFPGKASRRSLAVPDGWVHRGHARQPVLRPAACRGSGSTPRRPGRCGWCRNSPRRTRRRRGSGPG